MQRKASQVSAPHSAREGRNRLIFFFFFFLKVRVRGTKIIAGLPLSINSRVQDLDAWKIRFQYQWKEGVFFKGQFWKQQPMLSSKSCNLPCSSGHKPQPLEGMFSAAPHPVPKSAGLLYPGDFFPWWDGMSALERGHGESCGNEREGPQPYLCCHKLTSDGKRT